MKYIVFLLVLTCVAFSCDTPPVINPMTSIPAEDWARRTVTMNPADSLEGGQTYLSSYSQIYTQAEGRKLSLMGTISLRNINTADTVYIDKTSYYRTDGHGIRTYFDDPIFLAPLETVEIIISEKDVEGGSGDNFVFTWHKRPGTHDPFFEGVFISTYGQQGISFTTRGIRIE
ncbi:DUF3124 domain-containing protein [Neolewinella antarctica]|uniref:DUF3124 domain-containing protein n=1 Tax=Neolewinella antarctica TaxID=442734 RepID=A0ABX0XD78_9BACT|nr:DUF3124 domain-containing protein [Neolewinella antarctica]NJC26763.1 hypothetical protein [Neolewinella antarctica]